MSLGRSLKQWATQHGRESAVQMFNEGRAKGVIRDQDISLRDLAHACLGGDAWPTNLSQAVANGFRGTENSADAVDPTTFAAITGNLLIDTVRDKYKSPDFVGDQLCTTIPVNNGNLDTQKEPWLSDVSIAESVETDANDEDEDIVQAGMEYGRADFSPNYIQLARPKKRGRICAVTFEMIYADRTRQAQDSAASVGRRLGLGREYRILKCFLGITNPFTFSYAGGPETTSTTYHLAAGTRGTWVNALTNRPLQSWSDVNEAEQLFANMKDPATNQPIDVDANMIFVMPGNYTNALHVLHATQVRGGNYGASGYDPMSGANVITLSEANVKQYTLMTSKYAYKIANNNATFLKQDGSTSIGSFGGTNSGQLSAANARLLWLMGDPKRAFYYREVHPLMTWQAPPMNPDEFKKDIVLQVKAREFGVAGVRDPRYMARIWGFNVSDATTAN